MAIRPVYTCERCGRDFEEQEYRKTIRFNNLVICRKSKVVGVNYPAPMEYEYDEKHICGDCYYQFAKWMKEGKKSDS